MAANAEDIDAVVTTDENRPAHLWKPGQSGNPNGRPKGTRHKISEGFLKDFQSVWEEKGPKAIKTVAKNNPVEFVKIAASMVPKEQALTVTELRTFVVELTGRQQHDAIEHEDLPRLEIEESDDG